MADKLKKWVKKATGPLDDELLTSVTTALLTQKVAQNGPEINCGLPKKWVIMALGFT